MTWGEKGVVMRAWKMEVSGPRKIARPKLRCRDSDVIQRKKVYRDKNMANVNSIPNRQNSEKNYKQELV